MPKTAKRVSRFDNTAKGGTFRISQTDLRILDLLQDYECLPSIYIPVILGLPVEYTLARLSILRHKAGVLECPPASWETQNARYRHAIYALSQRGEQELQKAGMFRPSIRGNDHIKHKSARCITEASFAIGANETPGVSLVTHRKILEHQSCPLETKRSAHPFHFAAQFSYRTPPPFNKPVQVDRSFIHDTNPFAIAYAPAGGQTKRLFVAGIEIDRATEPRNPAKPERRQTINEKLLGALELHRNRTYQQQLGIPNAMTLFVTTSEHEMQNMMAILEERTGGEGSKQIAFKFVREFASLDHFPKPTGFMLTEPWQRVGHPPLDILAELGAK
jgi:hypothetical protein